MPLNNHFNRFKIAAREIKAAFAAASARVKFAPETVLHAPKEVHPQDDHLGLVDEPDKGTVGSYRGAAEVCGTAHKTVRPDREGSPVSAVSRLERTTRSGDEPRSSLRASQRRFTRRGSPTRPDHDVPQAGICPLSLGTR